MTHGSVLNHMTLDEIYTQVFQYEEAEKYLEDLNKNLRKFLTLQICWSQEPANFSKFD